MNFWNIQLHPNDLGWKKEEELLRKYKMIGLGEWEEAGPNEDKSSLPYPKVKSSLSRRPSPPRHHSRAMWI